MEQDNRNGSGLGFASGLIIGGLIGAVVAIVLAPQSGEETRELIRGKAHEFRGKAMDLASDLRDRATDLADDLRSQAEDLSKRGRGYASTTCAHNSTTPSRAGKKPLVPSSRTRDRLGVRS